MDRHSQTVNTAGRFGFRFWTPVAGATIEVGAERQPFLLPVLPLPVRSGGEPDANAIGLGAYDFLRQFPEAEFAREYAELLRDAFPHYLNDLAAQIIMINEKTVDAPYVQRKIAGLKILALLDPGHAPLLQQLGSAYWDLGLMFSELGRCRSHFLAAMKFLQQALAADGGNLAALNLLAQIDYWFGDYPTARMRWSQVVAGIAPGAAREELLAKIRRIDELAVPDHPVVDDLETIGSALTLLGADDYAAARDLLEALEADGTLINEMPMAEFFAVLGLCREHCGDAGGAQVAYDQALALDAECSEAMAGCKRIAQGGKG